jgi:outer membrane protein assembly factor BamB
MTLLALVLAAVSLSGCGLFGRNKDTAEPPAELVDFDETIRVRKVWSSKVGGGSERLRLGLKPASDGARIYAGAHDGQVVSFDAETGRKQWSVKTRLPLAAGPTFGEGLLAFGTTDGQLLLLDAQTGEERWRRAVGSEVLAPPAIAPNVVVLRTIDGRLRGFSLRDGTLLWTVEQSRPPLTLRGNAAPRVAGAFVVAGFDNGRLGAYEVGSGEAVWELAIATPSGRSELERLVDISAGLQVVGNDVYAVGYHGNAVGVDLTTGVVLWRQEMSSYAGLGADVSNVYVTDEVGTVVALNRSGGSPLWRQDALRLRDVSAPARYANTVVVGDLEGYLHWLDPADGRFLARERATSDRITAAPLVVGQTVFVQGDDGTLAAFTVPEPEPEPEPEAS